MKRSVYKNSEIAVFVAVISAVFILGAYISIYEVDQRPQPRTIYNLAFVYQEAGEHEKAFKLWDELSEYNETYGTNYHNGIFPHGRVIHKAKLKMQSLTIEKTMKQRYGGIDPLFNRGRK